MENQKNTTRTESPEKIVKRRSELITNCLTQLGTALGQKIPADRVLLYCKGLSGIGEAQLKYAFKQALMNLGEFLPSIAQLRKFSEQWKPSDPVDDSRHLLDRGDKPADWEPLEASELERIKREAGLRAERINAHVRTAAKEKSIPAVVDMGDFERRRREQLERFWEKNGKDPA